MESITVGVVSSQSKFCDIDANLQHFGTLIWRTADRGARLICFPELALTSYTINERVTDFSQKVPGPATDALCDLAAKHDVYLSVGMAEKAGRLYHITQAVIGPNGYIGKYRKYHPTPAEQACGFSPGKSFPTFKIDGFKLGINICADGRMQDTIDAMQKARVDIIHHPHGNNLPLGRHAEEWTRGKMVYFVSRAVHARAYILINNSAGDTQNPDGVLHFGSGALIIDPLGQVVKRTTQVTRSEKVLLATLTKPLSEIIPEFEIKRPGFDTVSRYAGYSRDSVFR